MKYNVVLVQPSGYVHALALWDVARLLHLSFRSLGQISALRVNTLDKEAVNVVLGYHLPVDISSFKNHRVIFYQLEQLSQIHGWFSPQRMEILRAGEEIWDYSPENVAFLKAKGLGNVKLLPLGFHEQLKTIAPAAKEFDVLFYGALNDRRKQLLERLARLCTVRCLLGVYGLPRDEVIARARIVLNLHFYPMQIIEQARLSYLINNGCFVVSEAALANPYQGMIAVAPYEEIPETCVRFLQEEPARQRIAEEGFRLFSQRPMTEYLRSVLGDLPGK